MNIAEMILTRTKAEGECLLWTNKTAPGQSPRLYVAGERLYVRPLIWKEMKGFAPPADRRVTTTCGNRLCVNPEHLTLASPATISKREGRKGTYSSPAKSRKIALQLRAKSGLTDEAVREIRYGSDPAQDLAARYSISKTYVNMIRRGEFRRDYSSPWAGL